MADPVPTPAPPTPQASPPALEKRSREERVALARQRISRVFGGLRADAAEHLLGQALGAIEGCEPRDDAARFTRALDFIDGMAPRDPFEAMLCTQLLALHTASLEFIRRSLHPQQSSDTADALVARSARLVRAFAQLHETLMSHRGKNSQQRVVVEHVHIAPGGQAIVGQVQTGGPGGGAGAGGST